MTIGETNHLGYLIDQIRSNLEGNEILKETPRAHAWLLTTLSIYGDQFQVLIDLYRLFREQNSYILLSFIIEHILQYHSNEIEKNSYLQQEFQLLFSNRYNTNEEFSYSRLHSLLSSSTREIISSFLIRKWYDELEVHLLSSIKSIQSLNYCREKALACLSLSSSSVSSILQLIIHTETKVGFKTQLTSLNILRCLFVQDLLPIVLENPQKLDIQSHLCHKWLIYAIEFYLEYLIKSLTNNSVRLEGNEQQIFQCENPIEQIEKLLHLALNVQQNFNWQEYLNQSGSSTRRQKLLQLRVLINRTSTSTIRCPFECYFFCTSFPIYIQSIVNLSNLLSKEPYKDYVFIHSTSSIRNLIDRQNDYTHLELLENFYLFTECLSVLQPSQASACLKLYQETIDKLHLKESISIYQRLLKIFHFYYVIQQSKSPKETKANKTIIIDDTPQSPTMQDESNVPVNSPLICPDIEHLIEQLNDHSLESRLQLCSLYSLSHQTNPPRTIVSFLIDTLIYLHENYSSSNKHETFLAISSDYSFIPRSYPILFHYLLDHLLQHLPSNLILLQIKSEHLYPKEFFSNLTPLSLRYIYDQTLLGQFLKYIQTTTKVDRRWITNQNKRKLDSEQSKLTDEQFIEKIIQHVSNITQWTDEQRRTALYTYIIDERQTLLQSF